MAEQRAVVLVAHRDRKTEHVDGTLVPAQLFEKRLLIVVRPNPRNPSFVDHLSDDEGGGRIKVGTAVAEIDAGLAPSANAVSASPDRADLARYEKALEISDSATAA